MSRRPSIERFCAKFALAFACALLGGCRGKSERRAEHDDSVAAELRLAVPAARLPAPAAADREAIGLGPDAIHPRLVPLALAEGVTALDPPMRVHDVVAVPGRELAVLSGRSAAGLTNALVDLKRGAISWIDTTCEEPVVHATSGRAVCGGPRGIDAIDLDTGKSAWGFELAFRAAQGDYVFGHDPDDPMRGSVIDARSGEVVARVNAPDGEPLDRVVRLCADGRGFDLFAMDGAELRRLHVSREPGDAPALLAWTRRLPALPSKMDLCDRVMLVELPGATAAELTLLPLFAQTGTDAGASLAVTTWWPAERDGAIATATEAGLQLRARDLTEKRTISEARVSGRLVASSGHRRLLRSVADTLVLLDGEESLTWLAAPVDRKGTVLAADRMLVGPRRTSPQTEADYATLWEIGPVRQQAGGLRNAPPAPERTSADDAPAPAPLPKKATSASAIELPGAGTHAVTDVIVVGDRLYALTLEQAPTPLYGAGIARFDLDTATWRWHRDGVCAAGAEAVELAAADGLVICGARRHYPGRGAVTAVDADSGEAVWELGLPTVDAVSGAGSVVIAWSGARAAVIEAASGRAIYELEADNGYAVRAVPVLAREPETGRALTRVVSLETGGLLVGRDPAAGGAPVWARRVNGYATGLLAAGDRVAVSLASGELVLVAALDGGSRVVAGRAPRWFAPGGAAMVFDDTHLSAGHGRVRAYGPDGAVRLFASFGLQGPLELAELRGMTADASLLLVSHRGEARALVVEPEGGAVTSVQVLPPRWVHGSVFGAVAGGKPIAGVVLQKPLAVQIF